MKKILAIISIMLILTIFISSCEEILQNIENLNNEESQSIEATEVNIGVVLPLSGGLAAFGQDVLNGIKLAEEYYAGPLKDKVNLYIYDEESDRTKVASAVERAIEEKHVVSIIGEVASSFTLAGGKIAEEKHVPMLSPTSTNPLVTQGKKYISRVCFIDPFQAKAAAVFAFKELNARIVTVFTDVDQDYSIGLSNYFIEAFKKLGGTVKQVFYNTGDTDFKNQISTALGYNSDAIYLTGYYLEVAPISKQARQEGFEGYIIAGDGAEAPELVSIGGDYVDGVFLTSHYHPDGKPTKIAETFVKMYKEKYSKLPTAPAALGFDAYLVMLDSLERSLSENADSLNDLREKLALEIRKTKDFEGASGKITIDENGNAKKTVYILKVNTKAEDKNYFEFYSTIDPDNIP